MYSNQYVQWTSTKISAETTSTQSMWFNLVFQNTAAPAELLMVILNINFGWLMKVSEWISKPPVYIFELPPLNIPFKSHWYLTVWFLETSPLDDFRSFYHFYNVSFLIFICSFSIYSPSPPSLSVCLIVLHRSLWWFGSWTKWSGQNKLVSSLAIDFLLPHCSRMLIMVVSIYNFKGHSYDHFQFLLRSCREPRGSTYFLYY